MSLPSWDVEHEADPVRNGIGSTMSSRRVRELDGQVDDLFSRRVGIPSCDGTRPKLGESFIQGDLTGAGRKKGRSKAPTKEACNQTWPVRIGVDKDGREVHTLVKPAFAGMA